MTNKLGFTTTLIALVIALFAKAYSGSNIEVENQLDFIGYAAKNINAKTLSAENIQNIEIDNSYYLSNNIKYNKIDVVKNISLSSTSSERISLFNQTNQDPAGQSKSAPFAYDSSLHINPADFYYADLKRTTFDGELPFKTTKVKPWSAVITGSALTGVFVLQHFLQQNTIWKEVGDFHFQEDIQYALWVDKFGHFFGTNFVSYVMSEAYMLTGFSWNTATVLGGITGLAYTGYVEILDGYSKNFGFSPSDFYADAAGATFFVAQHYIPFLQNFTPKCSYINPEAFGEKKRQGAETFIDDYSSQVFWLSINVHNLLPKSLKNYWPSWLELCFGYAALSLCNDNCDPNKIEKVNDATWGNRQYILSVDYSLAKLLPDWFPVWNWFKQSLMYVKMPAPAIVFGRETKFYLIYPFNIRFN